jgi:2-desacetyl-2-hydroxyethyl bacteriochlorophyllide A dehydrogenase
MDRAKMHAIWLENRQISVRTDVEMPRPSRQEALVRMHLAGICGTDLALLEGLYPFVGIPGHEFVGEVVEGPPSLEGRRVVGAINIACGRCAACARGDAKHCESREALGIRGRPGAFAEFLTLPVENLLVVPAELCAVAAAFVEPLAAAVHAVDMAIAGPDDRLLVVGAGRLGQLVCRTAAGRCAELVAIARDPRKARLLEGIVTRVVAGKAPATARFDAVIECSGSPAGLAQAVSAVRPGGRVVLKSTYPGAASLDFGRVVVDEIRIIGSRCGPLDRALDLLASGAVSVEELVHGRFPLEQARAAFEYSRAPGVIKVLLEPPRT